MEVEKLSFDEARVAGLTPPKVYSVPRRFGIGSMMAVATAYALAIWGMQQLDWPPVVIIVNAIFLTLIGVMQMTSTEAPRWASMLVGVACFIVIILYNVFSSSYRPSPTESVMGLFFVLVGGGLYGYLGGTLVAGVFLVIDVVAKYFSRSDRAGRPGSQ